MKANRKPKPTSLVHVVVIKETQFGSLLRFFFASWQQAQRELKAYCGSNSSHTSPYRKISDYEYQSEGEEARHVRSRLGAYMGEQTIACMPTVAAALEHLNHEVWT